MILSNTLLATGALMGYLGLERFVGKRSSQAHNVLFMTTFVLVQTYLTYGHPSLSARSLNVAVILLLLTGQCAWLLLRRADTAMRPLTRWVGVIFGCYCLIFAVRIVALLLRPNVSSDYFRSGVSEAVFLILLQMLFVLLTYALGLMVNMRLLVTIQVQEEKFSKAFHSERKRAEAEREKLVNEREKALCQLKVLNGLLPICASCKKIRDDKGYWNQLEDYITRHSEADFSHSLCPDCMQTIYPDFAHAVRSEKMTPGPARPTSSPSDG